MPFNPPPLAPLLQRGRRRRWGGRKRKGRRGRRRRGRRGRRRRKERKGRKRKGGGRGGRGGRREKSLHNFRAELLTKKDTAPATRNKALKREQLPPLSLLLRGPLYLPAAAVPPCRKVIKEDVKVLQTRLLVKERDQPAKAFAILQVFVGDPSVCIEAEDDPFGLLKFLDLVLFGGGGEGEEEEGLSFWI